MEQQWDQHMVNYNLKLKMEKTKSSRFEKDYTALKDFVTKLKDHMPNPADFIKSKSTILHDSFKDSHKTL